MHIHIFLKKNYKLISLLSLKHFALKLHAEVEVYFHVLS